MTHAREEALRRLVSTFDSAIVAFSGGVDSAYLAWVTHQVLGEKALAVTADSASYPERHRALAKRWRGSSRCRTWSSRPASWSGPSTARIRSTAATTASTSSIPI